jgi:hypothetical protein
LKDKYKTEFYPVSCSLKSKFSQYRQARAGYVRGPDCQLRFLTAALKVRLASRGLACSLGPWLSPQQVN